VDFTDTSTNSPTSWAWDVDNDGTTDYTTQNPQHIYSSAGTYTVNLTATNAGGSDTESKINYITVTSPVTPPVANFTASPTSGTAPLTVQFTDTSTNTPTSWAWDVNNDGSTDYTTQNPQHIYSSAGTYTVNLTATNAGGSDTESKINYITVTAPGPVSIFYDDFEAAFSGWTTSGTVTWYTGDPKIGTHSIQLKQTGNMTQTISTVGYTDINVSFYMGADGLGPGEYVAAYWYDGSTWTLMKQIGTAEADNLLHYFQYDLPAAADNNAAFALRFSITAKTGNDLGYVDNVRVMGTST